ncbi:MAG: acetolactate synthase, partial [Pirellulaceae bacterium]
IQICTALLQAEINIIQAYPLLQQGNQPAAVAIMVDNTERALETLAAKGFQMISEQDLQSP